MRCDYLCIHLVGPMIYIGTKGIKLSAILGPNKNQQKVKAVKSQPLQVVFAGFLLGVFLSTLTAL